MTFWEAVSPYQLDLSFSIGDFATVLLAGATVWLATKTHQIQVRQHEVERRDSAFNMFSLRYEIYSAVKEILLSTSIEQSPSKKSWESVRNYRHAVKYLFSEEVQEYFYEFLRISLVLPGTREDCNKAMLNLVKLDQFEGGDSEKIFDNASKKRDRLEKEKDDLVDALDSLKERVDDVFEPFLKL